MKSCLKWFVILGCILVIVILVFLQFFLGKTVKKAIESGADQFLTSKLEMQSLDFNILGGSVDLKGLKISNPEGFSGEYLYTLQRSKEDLSILALLKKQIVIEEITVKDSNLLLVRNKEGKINLQELIKKSEKEEKAVKREEKKETKKQEKKEAISLPPFWLKEMNITSAIDYVDEKISSDPFKIGFLINIASENIATFGPDSREGIFSIKGHLRGSENEFVLDINVKAPPLKDIEKPTFTAVAQIKSIDAKKLAAYKDIIKIEEGVIDITSNLTCVKGKIIKDKSTQKIQVRGLKLTEDFKNSNPVLKNVDIPEVFSFDFSLFGTIDNIQHNASQALLDALVKNLGGDVKERAKDEIKKKLGGRLDKSPIGGLFGGSKNKQSEKKPEESPADESKEDDEKSPLKSIKSIKKLF